jgi:hypothetical protein
MCHADYAAPLCPQKLALTSPTSSGCSVGIGHSQTQATEFVCLFVMANATTTGSFNMCFPAQIIVSYNPKEICTFTINYFSVLYLDFKFTFLP